MSSSLRPGSGQEPSFRRGNIGAVESFRQLDERSIKRVYRRWAPIYDNTFGRFTTEGRRHAVEIINRRKAGPVPG